jgi:hypothetical protein
VTAFRFPLDRVLDWRRTQLEVQEAEFRRRMAALAAVDRVRAEVEAAAVTTELEVRRWNEVAGGELAALGDFRLHTRAQERELAARRSGCVKAVAEQQSAMLEARRHCRLLERLKERRLAEWKSARDRELDQLASESYLAQWGRPGRRAL